MILRGAVLHQDFDACILVDGNEGGGKSVLGMQIAYALDVEHKIDIDLQICYAPEHFKKAVMTLKPGKAIVWDEARRGVNRRRSMGSVNLEITDLLAECRQHNLFLIVIMPTFYDMDMNVAVWRSRALIHVYYTWNTEADEKNRLQRGFFRFYSEKGKKELFTNAYNRRGYRYPLLPGASFEGSFINHYVVDQKDYRERKRKSEEVFRNKVADKHRCPECNSTDVRFRQKDKKIVCRLCGAAEKKQ